MVYIVTFFSDLIISCWTGNSLCISVLSNLKWKLLNMESHRAQCRSLYSLLIYIYDITSQYHMEKSEAGLKGLCIWETTFIIKLLINKISIMQHCDSRCHGDLVFSERELTFTFAICCRPSVCLSSVVGNARAPYSGRCNFRQYFYGVRYLGHPLTSTENFTEIVPGEPLRRGS